jgi:protein-tyrosine-phosphatase
MKEEGIDVSQQKVKTETENMVNSVDEIYVICPEEALPRFIVNSPKVTLWNIADPFDTSIENFRITRDLVKEKVKEII